MNRRGAFKVSLLAVVFFSVLALSRAARADEAPPPTRNSRDDRRDDPDASAGATNSPPRAPTDAEPLPYVSAETAPDGAPEVTPSKLDAFETHRLALEGHVGFGTPVGALGFVAEYGVLPFLGIGAGAGTGSGAPEGNAFHGALVARFRPVHNEENALVIGTAYSFGGYERFDLGLSELGHDTIGARWAHWFQADIGWERRSTLGFLLRLSIGAAWLLNPSDLTCTPGQDEPSCGRPASESLATLDITLGYSL